MQINKDKAVREVIRGVVVLACMATCVLIGDHALCMMIAGSVLGWFCKPDAVPR
jgi:hypothetical protein